MVTRLGRGQIEMRQSRSLCESQEIHFQGSETCETDPLDQTWARASKDVPSYSFASASSAAHSAIAPNHPHRAIRTSQQVAAYPLRISWVPQSCFHDADVWLQVCAGGHCVLRERAAHTAPQNNRLRPCSIKNISSIIPQLSLYKRQVHTSITFASLSQAHTK